MFPGWLLSTTMRDPLRGCSSVWWMRTVVYRRRLRQVGLFLFLFTGGECNMTCSSNAEECSQSCTGGNCQMICSPGVKQCNQICPFGNCVVQCDADKCSLTFPGGACTVIKSSTTPITTITTVAMTTTKSSGDGFKASVAWCLMFALFVMVENR